MKIKNLTPQFKRNYLKLIAMSSLLAIASCTTEESLSDLESTSTNGLSSKSVELQVFNTTADEEQSANPASNATDTDSESRWSGFGDPANLILDLGSVNLVDYINIAFHKGDERTNSFQVYTSNDNSTWTLKNTKTSSGNTEELEVFDLSNTEARYVRLRCSGNSLNNWNSINDIEIYGTALDGGGTPPPTIDPETPERPTGGTVEDIIGGFWKVTMPVDEDGNASPRNCSEYDCRNNDAVDVYGLNEAAANSDYNDYFYEEDGWVIFTAFAGGATTQNSQYPRCELRGLGATGDDDYFDMDDYQELNVTVKVLSVPEERPEVNMVQIHGPDDEPLRIEYNTGSQGLHVTYNEDNSWDDVMDYEIGDELRVRVVVENERISFWLDNLNNGESYNRAFDSSDDTGYFKVGCYLQSSISYCDVKSGESFCRNGGQSDDYDATGSVAVKDLTLIRDGVTFK